MRRIHRRMVLAAGSLALLASLGCRSGSPGTIYAFNELPGTLVAEKRENAQTIDLSRLASSTQNSTIIDVGDVLEVSIAAGLNDRDSVSIPVRVHDDGVGNLPVVGPVSLAGLEPEAAEAAISAACIERQLYRNPQVTVTMKHQRVNRVTVVGAVNEPGVYEIPRGSSDLLAALVAAGGLAVDAGTRVEIRNPTYTNPKQGLPAPPIAGTDPSAGGTIDPASHNWTTPGMQVASSRFETLKVDLVAAAREGRGNYRVVDGTVVMVEKRDPEPIHVMGLVSRPNRYEMPIGEDLSVLGAIALAGGVSSPVADKVFVIRKLPDSEETVIVNLTIAEAKRNDQANLRLSPGDVVSVEQTPTTIFLDALRFINIGFGASLPLTAL